MPTKQELLDAIRECEQKAPSYANCQKMVTFYSLLGQLYPDTDHEEKAGYSFDAEPERSSEFMQAIAGKNINDVLNVLDEHLSVMKALFPKEYSAVIQKIMEAPV